MIQAEQVWQWYPNERSDGELDPNSTAIPRGVLPCGTNVAKSNAVHVQLAATEANDNHLNRPKDHLSFGEIARCIGNSM
jgi:hypothetical protein